MTQPRCPLPPATPPGLHTLVGTAVTSSAALLMARESHSVQGGQPRSTVKGQASGRAAGRQASGDGGDGQQGSPRQHVPQHIATVASPGSLLPCSSNGETVRSSCSAQRSDCSGSGRSTLGVWACQELDGLRAHFALTFNPKRPEGVGWHAAPATWRSTPAQRCHCHYLVAPLCLQLLKPSRQPAIFFMCEQPSHVPQPARLQPLQLLCCSFGNPLLAGTHLSLSAWHFPPGGGHATSQDLYQREGQ